MVSQAKFPWAKLIAPSVGAVCGQIMVMVIDSESWVPRLLVPLFALIAWGADKLLSSMPEPSRPAESGWHQAGQPVESEWFQAGRPVNQSSAPEVRPEPSRPAWSNWLRIGAALWDRFLVAMVGPSRRMDENTKNALIGFGILIAVVMAGGAYFVANPHDFSTFRSSAKKGLEENVDPPRKALESEDESESPPYVDVESIADEKSKAHLKKYLPGLWDACPGLIKYKKDLTFVETFENLSSSDYPEVSVIFQIPDRPAVIPGEYRAARNTCYYGVSGDGEYIFISKRACASVCLDRDIIREGIKAPVVVPVY